MKKGKNPEKAPLNVVFQPETAEELINKYGTYNIQPTCDSDNEYPTIAQALPKKDKNKSYSQNVKN